MRQVQQLERKPPVTLGLMALMCGLHFHKNQASEVFAPYYLCPDHVLNNSEYMRIVTSGFIHVDDWHLYHNMISFLWKGYNLEYKLGSVRFLLTISYLLVLCHTLVVVVALVLATGFQISGPLHQCSVGFSGVLFALKVLLNHNSPAFSSIYGFQVPTKYAAWLELVVIHFLVPKSSFMGPMCGILAGYVFVYSPSIMSRARRISRWLQALIKPIANYCSIDPRTVSHHASRTSARPSTISFETDQKLARHLQEEECRSQRTPSEQKADRITPGELRRRRLARFANGQRSKKSSISMNRGVRHRLLSLGVWPSLLDATDHIAWKLHLFIMALLHFFFSSDKQWLQSSSSSPASVDTFPDATVLLISTGTDQQATVVAKRKRIIFVRHAESEWNVIFNRGLNLRAFMSLLRAVVREWLVLLTGDSLFLDSPLSRRGRFEAQNLQDHVCEMSLEGGSNGDKAVVASLSPVEALHHSPLQVMEESSLLSYLFFPLPGSIVVTSNLRRTIDTARIASASRLEVPGEKIHVLSCLQEIGRNFDTLAISKPHAVQPHEVLVEAPRGEKCHDELFDVAESHGNKAVLGSGRDRLLTFAQWVFKQPKDVVIVYGHSLWLRAFCREFFPRNVFHDAKSTKMGNCGVVAFLLEEHSRGGGQTAQYNIQPESFQRLV